MIAEGGAVKNKAGTAQPPAAPATVAKGSDSTKSSSSSGSGSDSDSSSSGGAAPHSSAPGGARLKKLEGQINGCLARLTDPGAQRQKLRAIQQTFERQQASGGCPTGPFANVSQEEVEGIRKLLARLEGEYRASADEPAGP